MTSTKRIKTRKPGRPATTGSSSTQRVVYRVTADQRAELEREAKRLGLASGDLEAKRRAFPSGGRRRVPKASTRPVSE